MNKHTKRTMHIVMKLSSRRERWFEAFQRTPYGQHLSRELQCLYLNALDTQDDDRAKLLHEHAREVEKDFNSYCKTLKR